MSLRFRQHCLFASALCLLAACSDRTPGQPTLEAVQPSQARPDEQVLLEIRGAGFAPGVRVSFDDAARTQLSGEFKAYLGDVALLDVHYVDSNHISARLPVGMAEGRYALRVEDPRGNVVDLADAFEITPAPITPIDQVVLAFPGASQTVPLGGCSTGITLELRDGEGRPAVLAEPLTVNLSVSPSGTATLHAEDFCADGALSQITIAPPATGGFFRFRGLVSGPVTITASADGVAPATTVHEVSDVIAPGTAPWAKASVNPPVVALGEAMEFDATASVDAEDPASTLEARWDFDGDGTFDTSFSPARAARHTFASEGVWTAVVEVRDPSGRTALASVGAVVANPSEMVVVTTGVDENDPGATVAVPGGAGLSLREALQVAAATVGPNTVTFLGPTTVSLQTALAFPQDVSPLTLVGKPGVVLDATAITAGAAITVAGTDTSLLHLDITGSPYVAVDLNAANARLAWSRVHANMAAVVATVDGSVVGPGNQIEDNLYGVALTAAAVADGNRITRSGTAFYVGNSGDGSTIQRNVVFDNSGSAVVTTAQATGLRIWHNTFEGCGGAAILLGNNNSGHDVRNNIFASGGGAAVQGDAAAFAQLDFNAHFANATGACTGGCVFGPNSIEADPAFVNAAAGDLRLKATSPLVDKGTPLDVDVNGPAEGTHDGAAPEPGASEASP